MKEDVDFDLAMLALKRAVAATFNEDRWYELEHLLGAGGTVDADTRLRRSLRFGDDDYGAACFRVLRSLIDDDRTRLRRAAEYVGLEAWLAQNEPSLRDQIFAGVARERSSSSEITVDELRVLGDLLDRLRARDGLVPIAEFRRDHVRERALIDRLVERHVVDVDFSHYSITRTGLIALGNEAATEELSLAARAATALAARYWDTIGQDVAIGDLARELGVPRAAASRAITALRQLQPLQAIGGWSGDGNGNVTSVRLAEGIVDVTEDVIRRRVHTASDALSRSQAHTGAIEQFRIAYDEGPPINRGGQGAVVRARNRKTGEELAAKYILRERLADHDARERFEREVRLLGEARHPHVVPLRDYFLDEDGGVLVMGMMGDDLGSVINDAAVPMELLVHLFDEATRGVEHIHSLKIVHRDLKPTNILLDEHRHARVADFGISRHIEPGSQRLTQTGEVIADLRYAAPELLDGRPVDERADIYSLALIALEVVTRRSPYAQVDLLAVPEHMRAALHVALQEDPALRTVTPRDIVRALSASRSMPQVAAPVAVRPTIPAGANPIPGGGYGINLPPGYAKRIAGIRHEATGPRRAADARLARLRDGGKLPALHVASSGSSFNRETRLCRFTVAVVPLDAIALMGVEVRRGDGATEVLGNLQTGKNDTFALVLDFSGSPAAQATFDIEMRLNSGERLRYRYVADGASTTALTVRRLRVELLADDGVVVGFNG